MTTHTSNTQVKMKLETWGDMRALVLVQAYAQGDTSPEKILELVRYALGALALMVIKSGAPVEEKLAARWLCQLLTKEE